MRSTASPWTSMEQPAAPQPQVMPPRAAMSLSSERTSYMMTLSRNAPSSWSFFFSRAISSSRRADSTR